MKFQEKTLELNITHEILSLTDSWFWILSSSSLSKYWKPKYLLPFHKINKPTAAGFHITTEGNSDSTGENGGGYDVRIKSGIGNNLLFIQYKLGEFETVSPDPKSIFEKSPHNHYKFKINGTTTALPFILPIPSANSLKRKC